MAKKPPTKKKPFCDSKYGTDIPPGALAPKPDKHIMHPPAPPASSTPVRYYAGKMDRLTPLDDVDLSVRTANACQNADIETLGELSQHTESWLRKHTYINGKGIAELRNALSDAGLAFRAPPKEPETEAELRQRRGVLMGTLANQRRAIETTLEKVRAVDEQLAKVTPWLASSQEVLAQQGGTPLKDAAEAIRLAEDGESVVTIAEQLGISQVQAVALTVDVHAQPRNSNAPARGKVGANGAVAGAMTPKPRRKTKRGA